MNKKIIGILICTLLIFTYLPAAGINNTNNNREDKLNNKRNSMQSTVENIESSGEWLEQARLLASDGDANDNFGNSVAIDGDYAFIGAPGHSAVYIFKRIGMDWVEEAKLLDGPGIIFGVSVALDGDYALIGAYNYENLNFSVYVLNRNGGSWDIQTILVPSDGTAGDLFGYSVAIDGDYALIGAMGDYEYSANTNGSAYVFKREGSNWIEQTKLVASDGAAGDRFGQSVSLDGDYAVVGAPRHDYNFEDSGSVYIFKRVGSTWYEIQNLTATDCSYDDHRFGYSVSIDGDQLLIGMPYDFIDDNHRGSAYLFKQEDGSWLLQQKLFDTTCHGNTKFGISVSIDGDYAMIGETCNEYFGCNSVYIFKRDGLTWIKQERLYSLEPTGDNGEFGGSICLDGNYALIGARFDNENGFCAGSAFVFYREPSRNLTIDGLCPIDLLVANAEGQFINKTYSSIPNATYIEKDIDGDGELDDRIFIPNAIDGLYTIQVIPEPESNLTDIYSLCITYKDITFYLAKDVMIQNIPQEGYIFSWPNKPTAPDGKTSGTVGEPYTYTSSTDDPDEDEIYYWFDWGDGDNSGWVGPHPSGQTVEASHIWTVKGSYEITVKAKDINDFESEWSEPLPINMPRGKNINTPLLNWLQRHPSILLLVQMLFQKLAI
jgi:hypothetical protein